MMGAPHMPTSKLKPKIAPNAQGFTMIELMITIVILGILTSAALPSFREFLASQRIRSASFDFMSMISLARSEAIKRNNTATLNLDSVTNTFQIIATGVATPIRQQEMFKGVTIECINLTTHTSTSCPAAGIIYNSSGRLTTAIDTPFQVSSSNSTNVSCISIDLSGLPKSLKTRC